MIIATKKEIVQGIKNKISDYYTEEKRYRKIKETFAEEMIRNIAKSQVNELIQKQFLCYRVLYYLGVSNVK